MPAPPRPLPPGPVLVVEDDVGGREIVRHLLALAGIASRGAASVEEALAALAKPPHPALIVLDTAEDGRGLLHVLAQAPALAAVPVVIVSGAAVERGPAGVAGIVKKPFQAADLYGVLLPLLAGKVRKPPPAVVTPYTPRPRKPVAPVSADEPADALAQRIEALHRDCAAAWAAATAARAATLTLHARAAELHARSVVGRAQAAATRAAARAIRRG